MSKHNAQKENARREPVIKAGLERFRRFGIRKVSMEEIAQGLRMSKKTLYQLFSGKEDLVTACTTHIQSFIFPKILRVLAGKGTPGQKLLAIFEVVEVIPKFMSKELMQDLQTDYPYLWEQIDQMRQKMLGKIEELVRQGIETGELRPEIHPVVFRKLIFLVATRILTPDVLAQSDFTPADVMRTMLTLNRHGIFTAPVEDKRRDW